MDRITEEQKNISLKAYEETGNMTLAAETANTSRITLWAESKRSKEFRKALDDAKAIYADREEARILKKHENTKIPVWDIFRLKALKPDVYREVVDHKISGDIKIISAVPRPTN